MDSARAPPTRSLSCAASTRPATNRRNRAPVNSRSDFFKASLPSELKRWVECDADLTFLTEIFLGPKFANTVTYNRRKDLTTMKENSRSDPGLLEVLLDDGRQLLSL